MLERIVVLKIIIRGKIDTAVQASEKSAFEHEKSLAVTCLLCAR
jgi:hypothetical protein